ncbi:MULTISPECIES: transcriptional regulator NrdR [Halobellus]|uniref:transcriptional regulator NrdR n=1 Tax=Halobellus TaxID=1073986 RepID=UPI002113EF41|nr:MULTISPECIES: transcriptional regulator NrdR [Halobellus]MDQ2055681.1 transcriptional regulator NrdR [Halobellus sp. H-GB7]
MECPDCGHDRTSVVDTRSGADGTTVRRRRECSRCSFRFTTYERPEWETLQVKKRDGSIEPFDREKIRGGIERAVEKRPVTDDEVDRLVAEIHADIRDRGTRIVSSKLVGELVSEKLREVDSVAYVRFVSVYKAFSDPEEFVRELDRIIDEELDGEEVITDDADSGPDSPPDSEAD